MTRRRSLKRTRAITRKEWMHIGRDASVLYFAIGMPLVLLVLFGYAVSFDIDHIRTVVVDEDRTAQSRDLVAHLEVGAKAVVAHGLELEEGVEVAGRRRRFGHRRSLDRLAPTASRGAEAASQRAGQPRSSPC